MARGFKTGGRAAGTPNRRTMEVLERLEQIGCDPIEGLARIAMDAANSVEIRLRAYSELAPYVVAKRKAVDMRVEDADSMRRETRTYTDQELHQWIWQAVSASSVPATTGD
jgi:hypothetical protein